MNLEKLKIALNSICFLVVATIAGLAFSWSFPRQEKADSYNTAEEYIKELQISFLGVKSDLVDATQRYIDSVAPNSGLRALPLIENCEKYKISVTFALAQGEIESHFGTKGLAFRTNSIWNVGAYDGHTYDNISYKFDNPNESIVPYLDLLYNNYLQNRTIEDLFESFVDNNGNRYATDKYYEVKLKEKYLYIKNNYKIDSLWNRLHYYEVRL